MTVIRPQRLSGLTEDPITEEERARRLGVEVERLTRLPPAEWMFYVQSEGYADKYGVDKATLKQMIGPQSRSMRRRRTKPRPMIVGRSSR
jgi:hypothetical protein